MSYGGGAGGVGGSNGGNGNYNGFAAYGFPNCGCNYVGDYDGQPGGGFCSYSGRDGGYSDDRTTLEKATVIVVIATVVEADVATGVVVIAVATANLAPSLSVWYITSASTTPCPSVGRIFTWVIQTSNIAPIKRLRARCYDL